VTEKTDPSTLPLHFIDSCGLKQRVFATFDPSTDPSTRGLVQEAAWCGIPERVKQCRE